VKPVRHLMKSTLRTWCLVRIPKGESPGERSSKTCGDCLTEIWERQRRARRRIEARARARRAKDFGVQGDMAKRSPCYACGRDGDVDEDERQTQPAHVKRSRGARGTSADITPLCARCHAYEHKHGRAALEKRAGLRPGQLAREADRLADLVTRTRRGARHGE
jgi:hypothetical protein